MVSNIDQLPKIQQLAELLEGVNNYQPGAESWLTTNLKFVGLPVDIMETDEKFKLTFDNTMFNCECCGVWYNVSAGYNYNRDGEQVCNECIENDYDNYDDEDEE